MGIKNICCIGGGYVGGPSGAVIANRVPHAQVTVVDVDSERIDAWNSSRLPVYEHGLHDLVLVARDGIPGHREPNLTFSTAVDDAIRKADLIFVSVNTPTKLSGLGAGKASDVGWLEMAIRRIARCAEHDTIVVQKSTVPCGTAQDMQKILRANARPGVRFEVLSNPEFLAEGTAIPNLLFPDRVLIGSFETETGRVAAEKLSDIYATWVPRENIITMNIWSAELAKLASNALLAQRISSINALSSICEAIGADVEEVSYACGLDTRIGSKMLNASVGFGGSCFKKDIMNLTYMSQSLNLPEVASYWESVVAVNEYQKNRFIRKIVDTMQSTLSRKKIAVLGFAYKKNTGDTRESAAISVVKSLLAENAIVAIFDPQVRHEQIFRDLDVAGPNESLQICSDAYQACDEAHAALILTEWDMFSNKSFHSRPLPSAQMARARKDLASDLPVSSLATSFQSSQTLDSGYDSGHGEEFNVPESKNRQEKAIVSRSDEPRDERQDENVTSVRAKVPVERSETKLDWSRVAALMQRPMHVFDGRNTVDVYKLMSLGFHVVSIGSSLTGAPNR